MRTFLLSSLFSAFLFQAQAQITIQSVHMPQVGETVTRYIDTIPTYGPGNSGPMQSWDFSMAISEDTAITQMVNPANTAFASDYPNSNLAMTGDNISYLFFNNSATEMTTDGASGDLLADGNIISAPFAPTLTIHQFPRTYNSTFDDTYAFSATADGTAFNVYQVRLDHRGHFYDTTDAYGQITTPIGTYECLRVKGTNHTTDSLWYKLLAFTPWTFLSVDAKTTTSYSWLALETKLAVAEYSYDSIGNPKQFVFSAIPPLNTNINNVDDESFTFYPNPATDFFNLALSKDASVEILSINGKLIYREEMKAGTHSINCLDWKKGIYLIRLQSETAVVNRKLVIR